MSFKDIGTAFLTGFLTQKGKQLTSANEKAEKYYDLQLQLAEQNKGKYKSRVGVANNLVSVANEIKNLFGTDEQIKAAIAQGPDQLNKLLTRMKADKQKAGTMWTKDYVEGVYAKLPENVVSSPEWLKYSNMSTTDYIMETMGIKKYEIGDYKSPDSNFWDKLSGKNKMARTRAELDELEFYEGMSVYDINQSANEAEYNSLLPGAFLEYTTDRYITADVRNTFAKEIEQSVAIIKKDPTVAGYYTKLQEATKDLPSVITFSDSVLKRTKDNTGKEIVNLNGLVNGQMITFEKHALPGITKEEFDNWMEQNLDVKRYQVKANNISKLEGAIRGAIRPAITNKIDREVGTYGERFREDASILATISQYLPDTNKTNADTVTVPTGAGTVETGDKKEPKVDVTEKVNKESVKNLKPVDPTNDKLWDWTDESGRTYRIISPNSNNPTIIPYLPDGRGLNIKERKQGAAAREIIVDAGLQGSFTVETIMLSERERQKKAALEAQGFGDKETGSGLFADKRTREEIISEARTKETALAKKIVGSKEAEDFLLMYQAAGVNDLSNSQILNAFKQIYKKRIPTKSGFEDTLAEEIRKALTKTNTKEE